MKKNQRTSTKSRLITIVASLLMTQVLCDDMKFFFTVHKDSVQCFMQDIKVDHIGKYYQLEVKTSLTKSIFQY